MPAARQPARGANRLVADNRRRQESLDALHAVHDRVARQGHATDRQRRVRRRPGRRDNRVEGIH
eukprot:14573711-Alexandrium_andersonii.AAC.1